MASVCFPPVPGSSPVESYFRSRANFDRGCVESSGPAIFCPRISPADAGFRREKSASIGETCGFKKVPAHLPGHCCLPAMGGRGPRRFASRNPSDWQDESDCLRRRRRIEHDVPVFIHRCGGHGAVFVIELALPFFFLFGFFFQVLFALFELVVWLWQFLILFVWV